MPAPDTSEVPLTASQSATVRSPAVAIPAPGTAAEVLRLAAQRHGNPSLALDVASDAPDRRQPSTPEVASLAHWVRGLALHELDRADEAVDRVPRRHRPRRRPRPRRRRGAGPGQPRHLAARSSGSVTGARHELARARAVAPPSAAGVVLVPDRPARAAHRPPRPGAGALRRGAPPPRRRRRPGQRRRRPPQPRRPPRLPRPRAAAAQRDLARAERDRRRRGPARARGHGRPQPRASPKAARATWPTPCSPSTGPRSATAGCRRRRASSRSSTPTGPR